MTKVEATKREAAQHSQKVQFRGQHEYTRASQLTSIHIEKTVAQSFNVLPLPTVSVPASQGEFQQSHQIHSITSAIVDSYQPPAICRSGLHASQFSKVPRVFRTSKLFHPENILEIIAL